MSETINVEALMVDFSRHVMSDFRGLLRNRRRKLTKILMEKFWPDDGRREVLIHAARTRGHPKHPPQVVVRFMENEDRFRTTCNTRQVRRAVRINLDDDVNRNLLSLYVKEIKPWLITTERTVRAPEVPMLVRLDSNKPVDILMPAAFRIDSVVELVEKSVPLYRMQNADKTLYYDIPHKDWIFTKHHEDFVGSYVVTNFNGEVQLIAGNIFHEQFVPFQA